MAIASGGMRLFAAVIRRLPVRVGYGVGRTLGTLVYCVDRVHRRMTLENLERIFGREMTRAERRRLARRVFRHLGYTAIEFCRIPQLRSDTLSSFVTFRGTERVEHALRRGNGIVFISGHIGSWELMGPIASLLGYPISLVVRPIDEPQIDKIVEQYRQTHGTGVIEKKRAALPILRRLARGECVGILVDQRAHREGIVLDFLGHPASTTTVPAELARRSEAAVIPVFAVRDGTGRITMVFEPELEVVRTDDPESDIVENSRRFQDAVERYVRRYPEQWLWPHERWKPPKPRHLRGYFRNQRRQQDEDASAGAAVGRL